MNRHSNDAPLASAVPSNEVLPHRYGTHEKEPSKRATEGLLGEADAGSGAAPSPSGAGRLGCAGVDREQLGGDPGVDSARRAATTGVGEQHAPSSDRAGDRPGSGVGEQEAGAGVDSPASYLINCLLHGRPGETLFYGTQAGDYIVTLNGYAVIPIEDYEQLKRAAARPQESHPPSSSDATVRTQDT